MRDQSSGTRGEPLSRLPGTSYRSNSAASVLPWIPGAAVIYLLGASVTNCLQSGTRQYLGKSQEDIMGVPVNKATVEDVVKLSELAF